MREKTDEKLYKALVILLENDFSKEEFLKGFQEIKLFYKV